MFEVKDDNSVIKMLLVVVCWFFFWRKYKYKCSGFKDGKDLFVLDVFFSDFILFFEDLVSLVYQWVQKVDCIVLRFVLILGFLLDVVKEMLVNEVFGKFCRCFFEVMKVFQQVIEWGVKDCLFVDYKWRSGYFDVIIVVLIKEIIEKN